MAANTALVVLIVGLMTGMGFAAVTLAGRSDYGGQGAGGSYPGGGCCQRTPAKASAPTCHAAGNATCNSTGAGVCDADGSGRCDSYEGGNCTAPCDTDNDGSCEGACGGGSCH